jgi:hypothetical protein
MASRKNAAEAPVRTRSYLKRSCKAADISRDSDVLQDTPSPALAAKSAEAPGESKSATEAMVKNSRKHPKILVPITCNTYRHRGTNVIAWDHTLEPSEVDKSAVNYFEREYGFSMNPNIGLKRFASEDQFEKKKVSVIAKSEQRLVPLLRSKFAFQELILPPPTVSLGPGEPFNFLALPAEMRNMVYEYVVGKNRTRRTPVFTSSFTDEGLRYPGFLHRLVIRYQIGLLSTTHQLRDEALDILYSQNTFHIKLRQKTWETFDVRWLHPWDATRITKLVVEVTTPKWNHDRVKKWDQTGLEKTAWDELGQMTKLRSLRLFVSVGFQDRPPIKTNLRPVRVKSPKPTGVVDNLLVEFPNGSPEVRQMIRNFIASIPPSVKDVQFGLAEADRATQELLYTPETLDEGYTVFVPADYMQERYEEFKSLQSSDVEL